MEEKDYFPDYEYQLPATTAAFDVVELFSKLKREDQVKLANLIHSIFCEEM